MPESVCPHCGGSGWKIVERDGVSGAERCNCPEGDRAAYRAALDTEVLMLDDLGTHRVTEWVEDTVTAIITDRCNNRKPLIATTNLPDPEVGDAIVERDSGLPQKVYAKVSLAERVGERARS